MTVEVTEGEVMLLAWASGAWVAQGGSHGGLCGALPPCSGLRGPRSVRRTHTPLLLLSSIPSGVAAETGEWTTLGSYLVVGERFLLSQWTASKKAAFQNLSVCLRGDTVGTDSSTQRLATWSPGYSLTELQGLAVVVVESTQPTKSKDLPSGPSWTHLPRPDNTAARPRPGRVPSLKNTWAGRSQLKSQQHCGHSRERDTWTWRPSLGPALQGFHLDTAHRRPQPTLVGTRGSHARPTGLPLPQLAQRVPRRVLSRRGSCLPDIPSAHKGTLARSTLHPLIQHTEAIRGGTALQPGALPDGLLLQGLEFLSSPVAALCSVNPTHCRGGASRDRGPFSLVSSPPKKPFTFSVFFSSRSAMSFFSASQLLADFRPKAQSGSGHLAMAWEGARVARGVAALPRHPSCPRPSADAAPAAPLRLTGSRRPPTIQQGAWPVRGGHLLEQHHREGLHQPVEAALPLPGPCRVRPTEPGPQGAEGLPASAQGLKATPHAHTQV
ncbi:Hypothetical predicted protein [Marmota monax]|uniref:Uncharacterized protein n=1 Tax=Marmota monax TaxID=9995 RepID=A0A5E4A2H8_MARMO|nr:Hypothetical predicted protein [Marmota monax]